MPSSVWFGSVKLVFVKVWLGTVQDADHNRKALKEVRKCVNEFRFVAGNFVMMFVLLRGALWLERRALNLVNFLCCGQVCSKPDIT